MLVSTAAAGLLLAGPVPARVAVPVAVTLLVLARGLAGGRRLAHHVLLAGAVCWLVAGAAVHRPVRIAEGAAAAGVLLAMTRWYPVRPHPRRLRASVPIGLSGLGVAALHGGWLAVGPAPSAGAALRGALGGALGGAPGALAVGCVIAALAVALGPAPPPPPGDEVERARVSAFVAHPAADSLAPFATRADRTYAFSPDGRAAVGYRVLFGVALAGGDPVGAPDARGAAVGGFVATCARHGWRPAVLGAGDAAVPVWRAHGVRHGVVVGDEAVLDVGAFSLASRRMRNVRQAVQRTRNAGLTVHIGQLDDRLAADLAPVLRDWLDGHGERGFAMILDNLLVPRPDCLVAVAYDRHRVAQAFARFAWCAAGTVLTLDVAPRRSGAPNGVVERLIVDMLAYGRGRGVRELSLNFAGLRGLYAARGGPARLLLGPAHLLDRWIDLGPLYRFTAKFQPRWRPRRVLMRSWWEVGWVAAAALRAEFGGGRRAPDPDVEPARAPATAEGTA